MPIYNKNGFKDNKFGFIYNKNGFKNNKNGSKDNKFGCLSITKMVLKIINLKRLRFIILVFYIIMLCRVLRYPTVGNPL
ncbi:hypothetical protein DN395_16645 [Bacillus sp. AR18-7]|nr:hypothetical protein DN395_16645 [Bacillus sp. AR18-7]